MTQNVILSICGRQCYKDQDPDIIELVTEGILKKMEDGWEIVYQESDLTGMAGVTTSFRLYPGKVVLTRSGKLNSQMVFQEGISHDSLYQMEFGALMMTVCASRIHFELDENGGSVELIYSIEIEQTMAGDIEYHLDIRKKSKPPAKPEA